MTDDLPLGIHGVAQRHRENRLRNEDPICQGLSDQEQGKYREGTWRTIYCRLCIKCTLTESASECMCVDGGGEGVRPAAGPVTIYAKTTLFFRFLHSKYALQAENQRRKMQTLKKNLRCPTVRLANSCFLQTRRRIQ
jgi:hypothetical protein